MRKIKTIFERGTNGKVIDKYVDGFTPDLLIGANATEKYEKL